MEETKSLYHQVLEKQSQMIDMLSGGVEIQNAINHFVFKEKMSKRECFAMAAMQGLMANAPFIQALGHYNEDYKQICAVAIGISDELLKQLDHGNAIPK